MAKSCMDIRGTLQYSISFDQPCLEHQNGHHDQPYRSVLLLEPWHGSHDVESVVEFWSFMRLSSVD